MKRNIIYIALIVSILSSCDCTQQADGVVLDKQTKLPVESVALGKYEKSDSTNPFSRRIYTDLKGRFDYNGISGGIGKCPDLVLYFDKEGYKQLKVTFESFSERDTVYLEKIKDP